MIVGVGVASEGSEVKFFGGMNHENMVSVQQKGRSIGELSSNVIFHSG